MKELFIKCPSCGAVLQVKNSKNEAVKQIVCPNCKKRLAVSFEEDGRQPSATPQPLGSLYNGEQPLPLQEGVNKMQFPGSQNVEINVVRLADGSSKCIVKALSTEETVKVNGGALLKDDQVVLTKGDKLEIGQVLLCYDKPCSLPNDENMTGGVNSMSPTPQNNSPQNNWWLYAVGVLVPFVLVVFLMWPKSKTSHPQQHGNNTETVDSQKKEKDKSQTGGKTGNKKDEDTQIKSAEPKIPDYKSMKDYDLEKLALHGDVEAQYEYGKRLVNKGGSKNTVLGLNYLNVASKNGSTTAKQVRDDFVNELKRRAELGDSVAYEILMKID